MLTSMALRDSMLKSRANPRKFRRRIRRNSPCVKVYGAAVVVALLDSSSSIVGALWFSWVMCATWNMGVVIINYSTYGYLSMRTV